MSCLSGKGRDQELHLANAKTQNTFHSGVRKVLLSVRKVIIQKHVSSNVLPFLVLTNSIYRSNNNVFF